MCAKYGKIMKDVWEDAISKCGPHAVAYLQDVHVKKALELLDRLCEEGIQLSSITFVSLLPACSCTCLVDGGIALLRFNDNKSYIISTKLEYLHLDAWQTFFAVLAIYLRQRI